MKLKTHLFTYLRVLACGASVMIFSGCGVETMGAAATSAVVKKQEVEQGQAQKQVIEQQLQKALDQNQQRQQELEQATK